MTAKHSEQLQAAAMRAGIVDVEALALADLTRDDGSLEGAAAVVAELRKTKPFLFRKHAREMTESEKTATLAGLRKSPKPEPMPIDKTAREMTASERQAFIRECSRRFG
jgi:hypothetical protein